MSLLFLSQSLSATELLNEKVRLCIEQVEAKMDGVRPFQREGPVTLKFDAEEKQHMV